VPSYDKNNGKTLQMKYIISLLFGRKDDEAGLPGGPYRAIGSSLILAGLVILSPSLSDAILAFLNKVLDLGLSLDAPWWVGLLIILLGAVFFIFGFISDGSETHKGQFVAVRHQSFQPLAGTLPAEALPSRMKRRRIHTYECDQSSFMASHPVDPRSALRLQEKLASHIVGVRKTDPGAALGYYGIVHIPFQFLAGCSISSYPEVILFEHNRNNGKWSELKLGNGPNLEPRVTRVSDPVLPNAVVIRIGISYPVDPAKVAEIIPTGYREYDLTIKKPGLGKITHYSQVEVLCALFRQILDEVHNELAGEVLVHVFYSGPVSLGFSLGRRISRTIHNRVFVYNFVAQDVPSYSWGIDVTRDAPSDTMTITPQLIKP
jgi:hypothetical protein